MGEKMNDGERKETWAKVDGRCRRVGIIQGLRLMAEDQKGFRKMEKV